MITKHLPAMANTGYGTIRHAMIHHHSLETFESYIVHPSDTLWNIAEVSGVSVSMLKRVNGIVSNTIYVGQRLRVPQKWSAYKQGQTGTVVSFNRRTVANDRQGGGQPVSPIPGLPTKLVPIYKAAGNRYGIPWKVLAAIHKTETNFSVSGSIISPDGAKGPMQFMPSTFEEYAAKPPWQHKRPRITNVSDAIYTAAHMLARDGFARSPVNAIYDYNHSQVYVRRIVTLAKIG